MPRYIHISQSAIKNNVNNRANDPPIAVYDGNRCELHHEYTITEGVIVRYDPEGHWISDTLVRVWVEISD